MWLQHNFMDTRLIRRIYINSSSSLKIARPTRDLLILSPALSCNQSGVRDPRQNTIAVEHVGICGDTHTNTHTWTYPSNLQTLQDNAAYNAIINLHTDNQAPH